MARPPSRPSLRPSNWAALWDCAPRSCRVGGQLLIQSDDGTLVSQVAADPTGVNMERVASATRAIHELAAGRLAPKAAAGVIEAVSRAPPASIWLFTLAAGA